MKLSEFKASLISKTIRFEEDKIEVVSKKTTPKCEVNFYNITEQMLEDIYESVVSNKDNKSSEMLGFMLIPYICDVEIDITYDEFADMFNNPTKEFMKFMEILIEEMNAIKDMLDKAIEGIDSGELKSNIESEIDKLYSELPKIADRTKKTEIMKKIMQLELKLGGIG